MWGQVVDVGGDEVGGVVEIAIEVLGAYGEFGVTIARETRFLVNREIDRRVRKERPMRFEWIAMLAANLWSSKTALFVKL